MQNVATVVVGIRMGVIEEPNTSRKGKLKNVLTRLSLKDISRSES